MSKKINWSNKLLLLYYENILLNKFIFIYILNMQSMFSSSRILTPNDVKRRFCSTTLLYLYMVFDDLKKKFFASTFISFCTHNNLVLRDKLYAERCVAKICVASGFAFIFGPFVRRDRGIRVCWPWFELSFGRS